MTWRSEEEGHNWLPVLLTFLLGLLIGWWVIGWWLWPVTYTDALPQDLRLQDRQQYLTLVADSFASSGDVTTAEARTATWPHDRLVNDLNVLQAGLASQNPAEAAAVQKLAVVLNASTSAPAAQGQPSIAETAPTAPTAVAQSAPARSSERPTKECLFQRTVGSAVAGSHCARRVRLEPKQAESAGGWGPARSWIGTSARRRMGLAVGQGGASGFPHSGPQTEGDRKRTCSAMGSGRTSSRGGGVGRSKRPVFVLFWGARAIARLSVFPGLPQCPRHFRPGAPKRSNALAKRCGNPSCINGGRCPGQVGRIHRVVSGWRGRL